MSTKKEKLLEDTYTKIINVGLCIIPYEDLSDIVVPELMLFGTTKDEEIFSWTELDAMFKSQYKQMKGFVPSLERKRLFTRITNNGNHACISEEVLLHISSPEAVNTIFIRCTCILEYIDQKWKLSHWHASTPVETENDHWHMEEWKREKEKLQKLVDQQTADLQGKNRELEIQASIERVRAVAMGMNKPDDMLKVCRVISDQLKQFGIEHIRNVQTVIINEEKGNYHNYQYFTPYDKESFEITEYHKNPTVQSMIDRMLESSDAFFTTQLTGEDLEIFRAYRKQENQFPDPLLDDTKSLDGNFFSIGPGGLGITLYHPLNKEGLEIFKRFHNVFLLAYRRFRDIKQAEAQVWEAEIQLALERVRARTMAMQNSDELMEVSMELFTQFKSLGELSDQFSIGIFDEDKQAIKIYATLDEEKFDEPFEVNRDFHQVSSELWKSWKSNKKSMTIDLSGESLASYNSMRNSFIYPKGKKAFSGDRWVIHVAFFSDGILSFSSAKHLPQETLDLLERFAKVFEQTYTRFLDLKKAEAQAREAQIEAALEKVRSRSLAMHKSNELNEVVSVLFERLKELQIPFTAIGIGICIEGSKDLDSYVCGENEAGLVITNYRLPYFENQIPKDLYNALEKQLDFYVGHYSKEEKDAFYNYVIEHTAEFGYLPEDIKSMIFDSTNYTISMVAVKNAVFNVNDFEGKVLAEGDVEIIQRFARVFDQAYTRFLDLQKAEAQAREAQIEVALEKVRSRTMGMRSSDELSEVANMLFLEVQALGINAWSCGYNILNEDRKTAICAMSSEGTLQTPFQLRLWGEASFDEMGEFINDDKDMLVQELGGEALVSHYDYMKSFPDLKPTFDEIDRLGLSLPTYQINHLCKFSHGFLLFITYEKVPDAHEIFKRFTKVFDQTYTRFLDLQKAEARAREAQIQTALERVRSHSMGMQSTSDFANVTTEMFNQLRNFGEDLFATGIVFCDKHEGHVEQWHSIPGGGMLSPMIVPIDLDYIHQYRYDQWKAGNPLFSIEIPSDFIEQHFEDIFKLPSAQITIKDLESRNAPMPAPPPWEIDYGASFKHGYILVSSLKPIESMDILPRFAQVFEQAYIRFLDLQKAEAQAREAQIENALEKVRSRSLAMQSPDEIIEVAQLLREEMGALGVEALETSSIYIHDKENNTTQCWFTIKNEEDGKSVSDQMTIDLRATWVGRQMLSFYKSSSPSTSIEMSGKHRVEWIQYCEEQSTHFSTRKFYGDTIPTRTYHLNKFSDGFIGAAAPGDISEESWGLLKRATAVFSFAYTRFRDLQKAEMRAREAQIEMALEKVRSRTMTMAHSSELADTSVVVFRELLNLGIAPNRLFIGIIKNNGDAIEAWATNEDGSKIENQFELHPSKNKSIQKMVDAWQQEKKSTIIDMQGQELKDYFHYLNKVMHIPFIDGLQQKRRVQSIAYFSGGLIGMAAPEEQPQETIDLLERFASVFNLTYTRFNDLKIAEAQAKEAQVELSLERIRAQVTGMQESAELLDIVVTMRTEFVKLGHEAHYFWHMRWLPDTYKKAMTSGDGTKIGMVMTLPRHIHGDITPVAAWEKSKAPTFVLAMDVDAAVDYVDKMVTLGDFERIDPQAPTLENIRQIGGLTFVMARTTHGEIGFSLPGVVPKPPKVAIDTLVRFAGVFDLAYKRFEDLKTAEKDLIAIKQARQKAEEALKELQATQTQLVQQEKLASLGQLTAGIAHEIKNPLNFVNNFSEVSNELIDEVFEELDKLEDSDIKDDIKNILEDVKGNLIKVHEHGTRADSIVKSMLQHSRGGSGKMEPTDLNALIKEYTNLSFHGMRAKKQPINVSIDLQLNPNIETVSLIGEDFSRVILNLTNNAFDAMRETAEQRPAKLTVRTKQETNAIVIEVEDNGPGIPEAIKDKILQPFFTTKKGTEGTGLGLSITNDIVKAHGGELKIQTKEDAGTVFVIRLPR